MPPRSRLSGRTNEVGSGIAVGVANGVAVGPGVEVGVGAGVKVEIGEDTVGSGSSLEHWASTESTTSRTPITGARETRFRREKIVRFLIFGL